MDVIDAQSLRSCAITEDGIRFRFNFVASDGSEQTLEMSPGCMRRLSVALQGLLEHGSQYRNPQKEAQVCHPVAAWTTEPSHDSAGVILTFVTPDDELPIAFRIDESGLVSLAEAVVEHELAAYPGGLHFT